MSFPIFISGARLIGDEALRRRMAAAARQRALERYDWSHVIRAYGELWRSQEVERQAYLRHTTRCPPRRTGPARYPAPEHSFAGYPTSWLRDDQALQATAATAAQLDKLLAMPPVNHVATTRVTDAKLLGAVLAGADGRPLAEVEKVLTRAGIERGKARATLAWMLKYDLLRVYGGAGRFRVWPGVRAPPTARASSTGISSQATSCS